MSAIKNGVRVARIGSGRTGVVVSDPMPAHTAGGALMVTVEWNTKFGPERGKEFIKRLMVRP